MLPLISMEWLQSYRGMSYNDAILPYSAVVEGVGYFDVSCCAS